MITEKTYASTIISSVRLEDLAVYRSCPVPDKTTVYRSCPVSDKTTVYMSCPVSDKTTVYMSCPVSDKTTVYMSCPVSEPVFCNDTRRRIFSVYYRNSHYLRIVLDLIFF